MFDFILNAIIWIFAIYGLIEIIKTIYYICTCTNLESDGIYFIVAVKNQEERIECFLRSILFKIVYGKEELVKNVIVTDLGSTDETKVIAKKLEEDYIELFKERPWILRYLEISDEEKLDLLRKAVKEKKRIYDLEEFKKYDKNS